MVGHGHTSKTSGSAGQGCVISHVIVRIVRMSCVHVCLSLLPALPLLEESAGHEAVRSYLVGLARCFPLRGLVVGEGPLNLRVICASLHSSLRSSSPTWNGCAFGMRASDTSSKVLDFTRSEIHGRAGPDPNTPTTRPHRPSDSTRRGSPPSGRAAPAASQPRPQHQGGFGPPTADRTGGQHIPFVSILSSLASSMLN